jgi:2'-phosphotransferase
MATDFDRVRTSKAVTKLLRHGLNEFRTATTDGFVDIDELLVKMRNSVTKAQLQYIADGCDKQRISIVGDRIRANQGHSTGELCEEEIFEEITSPLTDCCHATDRKALALIMASGLNRMTRKHIHFARDEHLRRKNCPILLEVDMAAAMNDGIKFYRSENNVILTAGVDGVLDFKYLIVHEKKEKKKH